MTWVKLCGMTRRHDVEAAVEAGADAVGFVAFEESPRFVPLAKVERLARDIPIERYLVTVDMPPERVVEAAAGAGVSGVQPHGRHAAEVSAAALDKGLSVLYPVAVHDVVDLRPVPAGATPLLDTGGTGLYGGSGVPFDWRVARGHGRDLVLAGGLTPATVAEAVRMVEPWGVDVSSGIETSPGHKDPALMDRFVKAAQ